VRPPEAAAAPTRNIEAYLAWLRGRTLTGRYTAAKADAAAVEFEQAIARDPGFAVAYAALYDARMQAAAIRFEDTDAARRKYRPLIERALALDPDAGAVLFAQAMWEDLDVARREAIFREAARRDPGNSRGLISFAAFLNVISNSETPALRGSALHARPHVRPGSDDAKPLADVPDRGDTAAERGVDYPPRHPPGSTIIMPIPTVSTRQAEAPAAIDRFTQAAAPRQFR
jgi:hypothetical protein